MAQPVLSKSERDDSAPSVATGYSLGRIAASKDDLMASGAVSTSVDNIRRSPCLKQAVLSGALVAALLAAHRFKEGGSQLRCASDAFLGFLGVFQAQWYLCRRDEHERREAARRFYAGQVAMQQGRVVPGAFQTESPDSSGRLSDPTFPSPEPWEVELDRLTRYELPHVEEGPTKDFTLR